MGTTNFYLVAGFAVSIIFLLEFQLYYRGLWKHGDNSTGSSYPINIQGYETQDHKINTSFMLGLETSVMNKVHTVLYNRVPKCGSTTFRHLIQIMSKRLKYTSTYSKVFRKSFLSHKSQKTWIDEIEPLKRPLVYDKHIWFVNFPEFGKQMPIYINLIRDPVNRFVSKFHYEQTHVRTSHWPRDLWNITIDQCIERDLPRCTTYSFEMENYILIPYFCGQQEFCKYPSQRALRQAQSNAVHYYAVVGTTEDYDIFLEVLEQILPQFFKGIVKANKKMEHFNTSQKKDNISAKNRARLIQMMKLEYEFYDFVKSRLLQLHAILSNRTA